MSTTTSCPTQVQLLDCDDIFSVIIEAIVQINDEATQAQIASQIATLCPTLNLSDDELSVWLTRSLRRGLIRRASSNTFKIDAAMGLRNNANQKYFRCMGIEGSFYKC